MPSFQISITPSRRAAARYVTSVRRALQKALAEESAKNGLTQSDVARTIGVHRSVINREIRGHKDITLGRVAELAHALGRDILFDLPLPAARPGSNINPPPPAPVLPTDSTVYVQFPDKSVSNTAAA